MLCCLVFKLNSSKDIFPRRGSLFGFSSRYVSMWVKVCIGGGYMPLVDFIDWLGLCQGREYFCVPSFQVLF